MPDDSTNISDLLAELHRLRAKVADLERDRAPDQFQQDLILQHVNDAVIVLDLSLRIQSWNRAAETIYGWLASEVLGKPMGEVLPIRYLDSSTDQDSLATLQQQGFWKGDVAHRHRDGHEVWIESSVRLLRDAQGTLIGLVGINRDITDRRQAEAERAQLYHEAHATAQRMNEALALLDSFLATAPVGFAFYDQELRFLRINEAMAQINGLPVADHLGRTVIEVIPTLAPRLEPLFRDVMASGTSVLNQEVAGEPPSAPGQIRTWLASYYPVRTPDGHTLGLGAVVSDITDYKRAEAALLASQELYRLITEHTSDLISLLDDAGRYIYASPSYQTLLGLDPATLIGTVALDLLHPDDHTELIAQWRHLLRQGDVQATCRIRHCDGSWRWIESSGSATLRQGAHLLVIVSRDVTERRRLEAQFIQAQKMESIGRLAGGIAHDFNNLLTAITGYTALALEAISPSHAAHADLREIQRAADRAATLTSQLLAFARKQKIEPAIFSLNDLIMDMDSLLRRLIGEEITLAIQPAADLGLVKADPGQIEQVLLNLVVNARDAMPNGGKLIVSTANAPLDETYAQQHAGAMAGAYVMLSVTDTGSGMAREVQAHIFEPFYTTKEHNKGTGLGLATCYGIIKQHSGYIWFASELGRGTTFDIYLPRVEGQATALPRRGQPERQLVRGNEAVLLVEDEPTLRALTARMLRDLGYQVLEAGDGAEALALAQAQPHPIQLLLTDVVMPRMRGAVLAKHLVSFWPTIRILFMSGYTGSTLDLEDSPALHTAFLPKPFSPTALAQKVREVLDA